MVWLETRVIWLLYLVCPVNILGIWWLSDETGLFNTSDHDRALGSPILMDPNHICKRSRRVGGRQREICANEPEIVKEVALGTNVSLEECKYQFRNRRWNCHTDKRGIQKVLKLDTREAAFVNAMVSAGIMFAITEACSMGNLLQCGCDNRRPSGKTDGTWEWGGCNDDIRYASKKTRSFMEVSPKSKGIDLGLKLQLHNYEAGRIVIRKNMRKVCKCHGLSGSCNLRTCWIKMPEFKTIGQVLREKFDGATKVTVSNDGKSLINVGSHSDMGTLKPISNQDLVYTTNSPSYCVPNKKYGSLGTKGRKCDPKSKGMMGCDLMCCGRGFKTFKIKTRENCKCKFKWCCEVICDICEITKTVHVCK